MMIFKGKQWEEMTPEERSESIEWAKSVCNKGVFEDPGISWRDFQFASEWLMHYQRRNDPVFKEITEKDVYGQELDPNRLNIGNYKSNYMNPTNANTPGRPEAFTNHLESKLFSIDETLTISVSRAIRKLNDLTGTPLPKAEAPRPYPEAKEPSPVMPCYTDRMYYLTASIERQLVELNDVLLRLEGF